MKEMKDNGEAWWRDFDWKVYSEPTYYPTLAERIVEIAPNQTSPTLIPLKCQSCGAPMKTLTKCEYCGTSYILTNQVLQKVEPPDPATQAIEDQLGYMARRVATTVDTSCFNEVLAASRKFKELGFLSG
jgi:hypothetical protein